MKNNVKLIVFTIALIFAFALILTGGMYSLAVSPLEEKVYNMDEFIDKSFFTPIISNSPAAQSELQQKFAVYNYYCSDENSGKTLTFFSKEQYDVITQKRKNGERIFLTYDEVLFIINDSIQMYNKYDTIILTNAKSTDMLFICDSMGDLIISTYHGDFSNTDYQKAIKKYEQKIHDIYNIMIYRLGMLDFGFTHAYHIAGYSSTLESDKLTYQYNPNKMIDKLYYAFFIDEGANLNMQEYLDKVVDAYDKYQIKTRAMLDAEYQKEIIETTFLEYPLLISVFGSSEINLIDTDAFTVNRLFPTNELDAAKPLKENYKTESNGVTIALYKTDSDQIIGETINLSENEANQLTEAYYNKHLEGKSPGKILIGDFAFYYRVDFNNGKVIYLPPDKAGCCIEATGSYEISINDSYSDTVSLSFSKLVYDLFTGLG